MNSHKKRHNFEWNSKYFTISVYSIFVILAGCIIFRLILNLAATLEVIRHFLGVMSPFLIGLLIAYMMNPFINLFYYNNLWCKIEYVKGSSPNIPTNKMQR